MSITNVQPENKREPLSQRVREFLWWCAGADVSTLKASPTDQTRYTALGMMVMVVPFAAGGSFTFFLTQTFGLSTPIAATAGAVWGFFVIFPLERLILTFHRKGQGEFRRALPRLVLAVSLAFLIGDPVLTWFFQREIELELRRAGQTVVTDARTVAEARFHDDKQALENSNGELQTRIDGLKRTRDDAEKAVISEIEGRVGSGKVGYGPASRQKDEAFAAAREAYAEGRKEIDTRIAANDKRLAEIEKEINDETQRISDAHTAARGLIARHRALFSIIRRDPSTALVYVPLFLILGMLEVAPIVNKLSFPASEYDRQLQLREKNAVTQATRLAALEREKQKSFAAVENRLHKDIADAVSNDRIANLHQPKRQVAELLQDTILVSYRRELLNQQVSGNSHRTFSGQIEIEIENRPDLQIQIELPADARSTITFADLGADVQRIADEAAQGNAQLQLLSAKNSSGVEIYRGVPLLPQLERDQKLRLAFAHAQDAGEEVPVA